MARYELVMPKMGESIFEATILNWMVSDGQEVENDEIILEVATDKVDSEIPSPVSGKVLQLLAAENDVVKVGQVIAIIETADESVGGSHKLMTDPEEGAEVDTNASTEISQMIEKAEVLVQANPSEMKDESGRYFSPLVRTIAQKEDISVAELNKIHGTGDAGRITKNDVLSYLENRNKTGGAAHGTPVNGNSDLVEVFQENAVKTSHQSDLEEIVEMTRVRAAIADHMMHSKEVAAHVTSVIEADMTKVVAWRNRNKAKFYQQFGVKLTYTPILVKIIAELLRAFPYLNATVEGKKIRLKKYINVGVATALPDQTLIVPVIKNADQYNLVGLAKQCGDLIQRARKNELKADEIRQGTFTLSNIGTFGNLLGTPMINQPEVAILAAGAIVKKPAVIETEAGDFIGIAHKMYLSLSFDHRIIDGYLGGTFLKSIADKLEDFDEDDF